jgi:hypothetical protein
MDNGTQTERSERVLGKELGQRNCPARGGHTNHITETYARQKMET